jgi:hypothetical protein
MTKVQNIKGFNQEFKVGDIITAKFASMNKNNTIAEYKKECKKEETYIWQQYGGNGYPSFKETMKNWRMEKCLVKKVCILSDKEYKKLSKNLLEDNLELFEKIGGSEYTGTNEELTSKSIYSNEEHRKEYMNNHITLCVIIQNEKTKDTFVVNTEGYLYARYVGLYPIINH